MALIVCGLYVGFTSTMPTSRRLVRVLEDFEQNTAPADDTAFIVITKAAIQ